MKIRIKYLRELTTTDLGRMLALKETAKVEWHNGTPYKVEWL